MLVMLHEIGEVYFRLLGTKERMKDVLLPAHVVITTSNMKILADCIKNMHQKACHTCSTIIFPHSTNQIIDLLHCRCHCSRHFLNFLVTSPLHINGDVDKHADGGGLVALTVFKQ